MGNAPPWEDRALLGNHDFGLVFQEGGLFGHVIMSDGYRAIKWDYTPGTTLGANNESGTNSLQNYMEVVDPDDSEEIPLRPTVETHVHQIFWGIGGPLDLRAFMEYSGMQIGDLDDKEVGNLDETNDLYWLEAGDTPIGRETVNGEFFGLKGLKVKLAWLNMAPFSVDIHDRFVINRCRVRWYDPKKKEDQEAVNEMVYGRRPFHKWGPGGMERPKFNAEGNVGVGFFKFPEEVF